MAKKDKIISEYKDYDDMINVLDKILELKKSEKKPNFVKRCLWITTCIAMLVVVATICFMIYKNSFSIESLISLLLAFFSIFISVFFYFKADDASNRFYETSYDFMKDVSVTLGKIEERFGEKLNNLNEKLSHLSEKKEEKEEKLESAEDEKQAIINELMEKAQLNKEQRKEYMEKLKYKDKQIADLQQEIIRMRHMERNMRMDSDIYRNYMDIFNSKELKMIQNLEPSEWPLTLKKKLRNLNLMDSNGDLTAMGRELFMRILD